MLDLKSPYIISSLAMGAVMFSALFAVILVCPFLKKSYSDHILSLLTMLAVGTLSGDAIFHLIPHSLGVHKSKNTTFRQGNATNSTFEAHNLIIVWKSSLVVASLHFFFIFNNVMNFFQIGHAHSHGHSHSIPLNHCAFEIQKEGFKKETKVKDLTIINKKEEIEIGEVQQTRPYGVKDFIVQNYESPKSQPSIIKVDQKDSNNHCNNKDQNIKRCENSDSNKRVPNVVWMIMVGDILHNITDGLAIGASFAGGISGGLSTSIAILCHEIPHEIGDFIILINSGFKMKTALALTTLTYFASFIGVYVGIALGHELNIVEWIFAVTAGMFLYISLVELLPDTIDDADTTARHPYTTFFWQNVGFLIGVTIMALIAVYEDKIKIHLS